MCVIPSYVTAVKAKKGIREEISKRDDSASKLNQKLEFIVVRNMNIDCAPRCLSLLLQTIVFLKNRLSNKEVTSSF